MECDDQALAARTFATIDSVLGKDNTPALDKYGLDAQLHYSAWKTELDQEKPVYGPVEIDQKLKSPYRNYFNTKNEKLNNILNNATHLAMGNHPDLSVRPSEVLGDNIVRPVEDSYRKYSASLSKSQENGVFDAHIKDIENRDFKNPELKELLIEHREDSGYNDALIDARENLEDKYGDGKDPEKYQYGMDWLKAQERGIEDAWPIKMLNATVQNITENHLRNNLVSSGRNYFDRFRAAYQFGIDNYKKGEQLWKAAEKSKSPELEEAGIHGSQFLEKKKGFDLFMASEPGNKGITYFAAKLHALSQGYTPEQAKLYGRKSIEQLQFQSSFINRPRAQWGSQGRTNLSLLTFGLHERRWYQSLWQGSFSKNPDVARTARRALLYYSVGNALLFGVNADIPEEIGQAWKMWAPDSYRKWREGAGTISLARALNLSMDEISRLPLTGVGMVTKIPVVYNELSKASEDIGRVMQHPEKPKEWLKAVTSSSMLLPAGIGIPKINNVGNKMTMAFVNYLYRSFMGDYNRTVSGKKYQTNNQEELGNALRGGRESFSREMDKENLKSQKRLRL